MSFDDCVEKNNIIEISEHRDKLTESEIEIIMQYRNASDEMKKEIRKIAGIE